MISEGNRIEQHILTFLKDQNRGMADTQIYDIDIAF